MTFIQCPECLHDAAVDAIACPNCGHPFRAAPMPVVERKVIIAQAPPQETGFPVWAFAVGILLIVLLFLGYLVFRQPATDTANTNINVNMARRTSSEPVRETKIPATSAPSAPSSSAPGQTSSIPGTSTIPPSAPPPDKGTVVVNARIVGPTGPPTAAKNAKFYLIDQDLETILSTSGLTPLEGNTLVGSLGLSLIYPDRYGDFNKAAMRALSVHITRSGTTNASGQASIADVNPSQYYLFAITRVGQGFALWNQPVSVVPGQNTMNLDPQSVTQIADPNG